MPTETFVYLTTIGHKSGQPHDIEIWYVDHNDAFYLCAEGREKAHWVQNILAHPQVTFSVGSRADHGIVQPVVEGVGRVLDPTREPNLFHIVTQLLKGKYGWSEGLLVEIKALVSEED